MSNEELIRISGLCRKPTHRTAVQKITDLAYEQHNLICKIENIMGLEPELGIRPTRRAMLKRLREIMNDREKAWNVNAVLQKKLDPNWDDKAKKWKNLPAATSGVH